MLPPFIIEQIRQREEEKERARRDDEMRPRLELPLDRLPPPPRRRDEDEEDEPNRGVVILELV